MVMSFSIIELSPKKVRINRHAKKKAEPNDLKLPGCVAVT